MNNYLSYIMTITICLNTLSLCTKENSPVSNTQESPLLEIVQNAVATLLTKPDKTRSEQYEYTFTDESIDVFGTIELKKFTVNAINTDVSVNMLSPEETSEDVIFIGLPYNTPKVSLKPENWQGIFMNIYQNTEFRRLPKHNFRIRKDYTDCGFVEWGIYNNQRVLFAPVGFKCGPVELPFDSTTHIVEGEFIDTNIDLNGICLIRGVVFIVADWQDIEINLNEDSILMNEGNDGFEALILIANWGRKITFIVDETMQWRSHKDLPFYVVQAGPGRVEVKIRAHDEDIIV